MSKQNHNSRIAYTVIFFGLLFSPMGAIGGGFVPLEESIIDRIFQQAHAQEFQPYTVRNATSETTFKSLDEDGLMSGTTIVGLPRHIEDNQGDWVAELFVEDEDGAQLESATSSYYYDKESCAMTQYADGRITSLSNSLIDSNTWVVKSAVNGTDTWVNVQQNDKQCIISTTVDNDSIILNSTKSDNEGVITEIHEYKRYSGLKSTIYYTNNDPALNNHKFSFSHIMQDTPDSAGLISSNGTHTLVNRYSMHDLLIQPVQVQPAIKLNSTAQDIIQFDRDEFFINGTQVTDGFTWFEKLGGTDSKMVEYTFDTGINELWALKFLAQTDGTLDVYVDYANINEVLPFGNTTSIDPTSSLPASDHQRLQIGASSPSGQDCTFSSSFLSTSTGMGVTSSSGLENCYIPIWKFDIGAIPDTATPTSATWNVNQTTAGTCFSDLCRQGHFFGIASEDVFGLTAADLRQVFGFDNPAVKIGGQMFNFGSNFNDNTPICGSVPCTLSQTKSNVGVDLILVQLELQLESGRDYFQLFWCPQTNGACGYSSNQNGSGFIQHDEEGTFLSVDWEQFAPPSEPLNVVVTYSPAPDTCSIDWDAPSNNGGSPITGYQVQRSSGGAFQIIEADTGSPLPTDYDDTTIIADVSYTYIINAINSEGIGTDSLESNGCGIPVISAEPTLTGLLNTAFEQVAVDWLPPTFDGNDAIIGYQIERTEGTPDPISDEWFYMNQRLGGNYVTMPESINSAGFKMGATQSGGGILAQSMFWKSFDADTIRDQEIRIDAVARSFGDISGCTGTMTFQIYDGALTHAEMDTTNSPYDSNNIIKGHGLLQTVTSSLNCTPFVSTVNHATPNTLVPIDISVFPNDNIDPSGQVTVVIKVIDTNGLGSCVICNWDGTVREIEITNVKEWNFDSVVFSTFDPDDPINCQYACGTVNAGEIILLQDPLGFEIIVADTGDTLLEHIDTTVEQLTNYGYRVSAINSIGISDPSNILAIFTAGQPEAPNVPTVTAVGTTTIDVSWVEPELNGGAFVGYEIERKLGTGGIFTTLETGFTETIINDGEGLFQLIPAQEYCYRVSVETAIGQSAFSGEACATTFDAPSQVQNLVVTALDGSSVNMSFDDPATDGGSSLLGFKVDRQIAGGGFVTLDELTTVKFRNDTGLPVGSLIEYRVSASNQFGFGATLTASDTTDATPQVPPNFTCSASSASSITLDWDTPVTFSAPTGYQIDRATVGGGFSTLVPDTADTATTFTNTGLGVDDVFEYRILAHTAEGDTDFTEVVTCGTLGAPDFPPENLLGQFTSTVPHQMVLAWDIPDTFGVPITSFRVERDDGAGYNEIASVSPSTFMYIDQAPDNDVSQKYRIFTIGSEGESPPAIAVPFTANQTSHWHYEKSPNDTGENKNTGAVIGTANFDNSINIGLAHTFDGLTRIEVDPTEEADYDFDTDSFGFTTYFQGNSTGSVGMILAKASSMTATGYKFFIDSTGVPAIRLTTTSGSNEIHILGSTNVTDNNPHFIGIGYNGNQTANGVSLMVDGVFETKNVVTNNLVGSILNNNPLAIGTDSSGNNNLVGILDDTRVFGSGTLDDATMEAVANNAIETVIPINATMTLNGSVFADFSSETPIIIMTSGYPIPTVDQMDLLNFTVTNVNTVSPATPINEITGIFILNDPSFFNQMSSLSNYTSTASISNSEETFPLLSNFDIQEPLFTFSGDFFFQQARKDNFSLLSFNYTQTVFPFDLSCNFKSTLFENGTTVTFNDVSFVQHLQPVPVLEDVVVACIDPNTPPLDPSAPSFGGNNALLSFVSFGDTTGIGNFLNFTNNFGDFFGVGLPFLFVIILAAAFTGRSAPTGILIIGIALGLMWALGILQLDPYMFGIILVLIILGVLGGKKFL